jgi:hypothetical protein
MDRSPVDIHRHLLSHSALLAMGLRVPEPARKKFISLLGFSGREFGLLCEIKKSMSREKQNCEINALSSAEVLVPVYQAIWCHIAENINPDTRRTEYLMSQSSTPLHIFASFSRSPLSK